MQGKTSQSPSPIALKASEGHINRLNVLQHIMGNVGNIVGGEARVEHINCAAKSFPYRVIPSLGKMCHRHGDCDMTMNE